MICEFYLNKAVTLIQKKPLSSLVAQKVKDLVLSRQWLRSLLWRQFNPWLENFYVTWTQPTHPQIK